MADQKISELTALTGANVADDDAIAIVDTSATETKKIVFSELKNALDTATGFVRITGDTMTGDLSVPNVIVSGNVDGRDVATDGTKLDGIAAGANVGIPATGGTMTGNLSMGDNNKIIMGSGSDLQLFHDGTNSFVKDAAAGDLILDTNGDSVRITHSANGETMARFQKNNKVELYYDNAISLSTTSTGIETGSITAGASNVSVADFNRLSSDGDICRFQKDGTTAGIISSVSSSRLKVSSNDVQGYFFLNNGTANASNKLWLNGSLLAWDDSAYDIGSSSTKFKDIHLSGKIQLGGTGAEKLYVEGTNPRLYVKGDSNSYYPSIRLDGVNGGISLGTYFGGNISGTNGITFLTGSSATDSGTERMRITSSGSVRIGAGTGGGNLPANTSLLFGSDDNRNIQFLGQTTSGVEGTIGAWNGVYNFQSSKIVFNKPAGNLGEMQFYTNQGAGPVERMRITSSGSVGIGVAPSTKLHVKNGTNQNFNVFGPGVFSNGVTIASTTDGFTGYLEMEQRASQFAWHNGTTERMRLTSGGYLALGNTLIPTSGTAGVSLSPDGNVHCGVTGTSAADVARFDNANGRVGSITASGSATNYNTSSDYRLKENVVYDWDATTRLKQLKPARFNFISDAETTVDGFIAHEAQAVVPEAVMGTHNEVDDDGNAVMQGIDQAKLVPLLVKTIQELEARITALENA